MDFELYGSQLVTFTDPPSPPTRLGRSSFASSLGLLVLVLWWSGVVLAWAVTGFCIGLLAQFLDTSLVCEELGPWSLCVSR